jgi:hypothetical protein
MPVSMAVAGLSLLLVGSAFCAVAGAVAWTALGGA